MKTSSRRMSGAMTGTALSKVPAPSSRLAAVPGPGLGLTPREGAGLGLAATLGFILRLPLAWLLAWAWILRDELLIREARGRPRQEDRAGWDAGPRIL